MNLTGLNLLEQARVLIKDGIDYMASVIALLQAQLTQYALSAVLFTVLVVFSSGLFVAGFVMVNVAAGVWLARVMESALTSLLILGSVYFLGAVILGGVAVRWLKKLSS